MYRIILMISMVLLAGCGEARQMAIETSAENLKNVETMRKVAQDCHSVCMIKLGFIEEALGNRIKELSQEDVEGIDKIKQLAEKTELSDYELGQLLCLMLRLWSSAVEVALEKYTPDMLGYLALVF